MSIFTRRADPIEASSLVEKRGLTKNIKIPEFYNFVLLTEAL